MQEIILLAKTHSRVLPPGLEAASGGVCRVAAGCLSWSLKAFGNERCQEVGLLDSHY